MVIEQDQNTEFWIDGYLMQLYWCCLNTAIKLYRDKHIHNGISEVHEKVEQKVCAVKLVYMFLCIILCLIVLYGIYCYRRLHGFVNC